MQKLKPIATILLLMTYIVSFGHNLIPHHQHDDSNNHHHYHSEKHNHTDTSHGHVAHKGHFDEGVFDYLACVFGDHEHNSVTDCEFVQTNADQSKTTNQSLKINHLVVYNLNRSGNFISKKHLNYTYLFWQNCGDLYAYSIGKRGPPMI